MKKFLSIILSMLLLMTNVNISYASSDDFSLENNIYNKRALEIYESLGINENKEFSKKFSLYGNNSVDAVKNENDFENDLVDTFAEFKDIESVYSEEKDGVFTNIIKSKSSNNYGIIEVDENKNDLFLSLNGKSYKLFNEGENIYISDSDNNTIPIVYTINESTNNAPKLSPLASYNSAKSHKFGKYYGPMYKTNKVLFEVIEVIGTATGVAGARLKNPVLGTISLISGVASTVGSRLYQTMYIKYWQAFSINDPTYVKEKCNYYKYSNYTGFVKTTYNYFYSTRPY